MTTPLEHNPLEHFQLSFLISQTIAMALTALILPRLRITSIFGALITVVALALVNATLWDAALFFELPDTFSVHAALVFLANGVLFFVLVKILPGIEMSGIAPAFLAPVIFTVCNLIIHRYGNAVDWQKVAHSGMEYVQGARNYLHHSE